MKRKPRFRRLSLAALGLALLAAALAMLAVSGSATGRSSFVPVGLYDQYNNYDGSGTISNVGGALGAAYDAQVADDFIVPTGETWAIGEVDVGGDGCTPGTSVNVFVYTNSASNTPGTQVYSTTVSPADGLVRNDCSYMIPVSLSLGEGHYWLSVQAKEPGDGWYWWIRSVISNLTAKFQNPGGGYGTDCITWCDNNDDSVFRLRGPWSRLNQAALSVTGPASATYLAADETITTSGGTGTGPLTFDTGSSTACSIVDGKLHVTAGSGSCTITAMKEADGSYNPTTSSAYTVTINKAAQDPLSVTGPSVLLYGGRALQITTDGGSLNTAVTFDAGSSTACSVVNSSTLQATAGTGTCTITATMAGDTDYAAVTSDPYTVTIEQFAGTPGTKTCVKVSISGEETRHGSLKQAATYHSYPNATALRKDITSYCKTTT